MAGVRSVLLASLPGSDWSVAEGLAIALSIYSFWLFIRNLGETIALLPCIGFIASLEILFVPALTYRIFTASMPIESTRYFAYALPAYIAFHLGINGLGKADPNRSHQAYFRAIGEYLKTNSPVPVLLLGTVLVGFAARTSAPGLPTFAGLLPSYCLFISAFYASFCRPLYRFLIVMLVIVVAVGQTVSTGMFGDLFAWTLLALIFLSAGAPERLPARRKWVMVGMGLAGLLLIQSIKGEYRYNTWGYQRNERRGDLKLMVSLLIDRLRHPENVLTPDHAFLSIARFNQGLMIGSAMAKVPMHEAYAGGEVLLSLVYPLVPRLIWPNKPQTGGYENIRRFTSLPQFENTSINLSPLGEGYVNFGYGGILFSLLYGLLLRGAFTYGLRLADHRPTVILWLPMLFIGCLTMETDLLSAWGSLLNNAMFVWLLFWSSKYVGIQL